jgi:hypothetical protein
MAIKGHRYSALSRCWYYRELAGRPIERFAPLLNLLFDLLAIPGFLEHHNPKHSWLASQESSPPSWLGAAASLLCKVLGERRSRRSPGHPCERLAGASCLEQSARIPALAKQRGPLWTKEAAACLAS